VPGVEPEVALGVVPGVAREVELVVEMVVVPGAVPEVEMAAG
jgi:hypothetical protein